jgi:PAS domain S-box-containing protein
MEAAESGVFITNITGSIVWTNKAFNALTGYNKSELIGKTPEILKSGEQDEHFYGNLWENISKGIAWHGKLVNRKKDGTFFTGLEMITPIKNYKGEIENYVATVHDISGQKKIEEELKTLNRALKTINACNSVLIHSSNETELLNKICELIVDTGGYNFTWIGLLVGSPGLSIMPVAYFGINENKLKLMMPYLNFSNNRESPIIKAIELKKYQMVKYSTDESEYFVRNRFVAENNFQSMIAFPLIESNDIFGVMCIYSNNLEVFNDNEIKLLEELSDDISYTIKALRIKLEREKAGELP